MKEQPTLILASSSPRRQELLKRAGIAFETINSEVAEHAGDQLTGTELAGENAYRKARSVAERFPHRIVLGADTVVCLGTKKFGKPADLNEAVWMLEQLQGQTHKVITGVALVRLVPRRVSLFTETTSVTFRPLTREQIEAYLSKVDPLDKAGAYAIQEHGDMVVAKIDGSYSNVVGLPMERLLAELADWGIMP